MQKLETRNNDTINDLYIENGKIGTLINQGSFKRGTNPSSSVDKKLVLVSGIEEKGNNWTEAFGPFDVSSFEDGTITLISITDFGYANYILRIGNNAYQLTDNSLTGTFTGDIVVYKENITYNEIINVGKVFKAFKLEE